jgi:hypothetical protein
MIKWTPSGYLDIKTEPSDLPVQVSGKAEVSGAIRWCTNLDLTRPGMAVTRKGMSLAYSPGSMVQCLWAKGSDVYYVAGGTLYKNGKPLGKIPDQYYSIIAAEPFNVNREILYLLGGGKKYALDNDKLRNWGIQAPSRAPNAWGKLEGHTYTYEWEGTQQLTEEEIKAQITKALQDVIGMQAYDEWGLPIYYYNLNAIHDWEKVINSLEIDIEPQKATWTFERQKEFTPKACIGIRYTYVRKNGAVVELESNPSPSYYLEADTAIWVQWEPSPDPQVTHVRIYRTTNGGGTFYLAAEFEVSSLKGALLKSDLELGPEVEVDHDIPQDGSAIAGPDYNGYCFMSANNRLYFCKAKQPEYWPALYYLDVSPPNDPILDLLLLEGQLYALTRFNIYQIQGSGAASFFPISMKAKAGILSKSSYYAAKGHGVIRVLGDGIYTHRGGEDIKISGPFDPLFNQETVGPIEHVNLKAIANSHLIYYQGKLYFFYPGGSAIYPNNALVFDVAENFRAMHYKYPKQFNIIKVDGNDRLLACATDGNIYQLETGITDDGAEISWEIKTKDFSDQLHTYFPRYARYDVELTNSAIAAGEIILDDIVKQQHAISNRNTRYRHITTCQGNRLAVRIRGTGQAKIYSVEVE